MGGVILTSLKKISHEKGNVLHAMKKSDVGFKGFGEAYFSTVLQNDIKGWKKHTEMTMNLVVPIGEIKFVLYSDTNREFFTVNLSQENYQRLTVPPNIWVAFRGIDKHNMLLNLASLEHNPEEAVNLAIEEIVYEW